MASVEEIRNAQSAKGPATVLAIGIAMSTVAYGPRPTTQ